MLLVALLLLAAVAPLPALRRPAVPMLPLLLPVPLARLTSFLLVITVVADSAFAAIAIIILQATKTRSSGEKMCMSRKTRAYLA